MGISIPAWFDWRRAAGGTAPTPSRISIPAWFDWRRDRELALEGWFRISIPAWFDWRHGAGEGVHGPHLDFNPSLVRLARVAACT